MSYSQYLVLSSDDVYNDFNQYVTGSYGDFTVKFNRSIRLPPNCNVSFIKGSTYYSWGIVSADNKNNAFEIRRLVPPTNSIVTLPDGIYDLNTLNSALINALYDVFHVAKNNPVIRFSADIAQSKFIININDANFQLNLNPTLPSYKSVFYKLLGFFDYSEMVITSSITAPGIGNINFDINQYYIHCDLVSQSVVNNDVNSSVIHTFVPNAETGSLLLFEPNSHIYLPVNNREIYNVKIWVTDNKNRKIKLNEPITVILHLTDVMK